MSLACGLLLVLSTHIANSMSGPTRRAGRRQAGSDFLGLGKQRQVDALRGIRPRRRVGPHSSDVKASSGAMSRTKRVVDPVDAVCPLLRAWLESPRCTAVLQDVEIGALKSAVPKS